ncbi:1-acyl-sn-glycerol-3-phosphate acyltransferase [Solirubrobacter deserti]|uniref:1-acyl-sn-glycerol-3-phosphate acyltransferase n=1 Tax=Solirubrobacter deserti TaxID=2282478 RepID=A0ABT4RNH9_9ACTN|nr:1-acyl-sn-glycerol-3-phosphate acyltransferase [Solirubrobacter deserti]MDA0140072.1 1-acyl-sn-glycerol-3-phosphate acyltransferase [Solirubrobacter deserti]
MHARARTKGVNPIVYWLMRAWLQPFAHIYWRLSRIGREHIPAEGPVIFVSNHRSFIDPFIVGLCSRRPVYYVAKQELFTNKALGWFLSSLGAFPVKRGEADADMIETAKAILRRGDPVLIFPEGTRIRPGALGKPKRGVGRLALETGATVVPVAIKGTEAIRKGFRVRPHKVRVRIGAPLNFPQVEVATGPLAAAVTDRIWPNVMLQWEWLGGLPPLRRAAVIGGGAWGTAMAVMLARAGIDVDLGCRTQAQADLINATRENPNYLPGVELAARITATRAADLELGRHDLVAFAVPAAELPQAVAAHAPKLAPRAGVLVLSKGLVPPLGTLPSSYVAERTPSWAVGVLGGPGHAADALAGGASLVLAAHDASFSRQVSDALFAAGLQVTQTTDVIGVELAGCAKNAAALAAAAAPTPNAAGSAAGKVFAEIDAFARASGAHPSTFAGLAGTGDLVATVLAEGSRNRRAGELLAQGVPAAEIDATLGQTAEAVNTVPLLAARLKEAGVDAPALRSLAGMIEGNVEPDRWQASLTAPKKAKKAQSAKAA